MINSTDSQTFYRASLDKPVAEEITWKNLLRWANRTFKSDQQTYKSLQRGINIHRFTASAFPSLRRPLFLIGSPRSGTTFLGHCIASLPHFSYHFEPIATKAAVRYVYNNQWSDTKAHWFYKSVYGWLSRIHLDGDLRFAEKTPRNCFIIPFLANLFPKAQFIHIIRDGRDVALSLSKKPWFLASEASSGKFEPGGYPYGPFAQFWVEKERVQEFEETSDIHRCIWVWKRFTEAALASAHNLPKDRFLEIYYESLVTEPTKEIQRLQDFLDIRNPAVCNILSHNISNVNPNLSGQWKNQLSRHQLNQIYKEAKQLFVKLGYRIDK